MKTRTVLGIVVGVFVLFGLLVNGIKAQVVATAMPNEIAESLKGVWATPRGSAYSSACTPCTLTVVNVIFDPSTMSGEFTGTHRTTDSMISVTGSIKVEGTKVHLSFVTNMGGTMKLIMSNKKLEGDVTGAVNGKKVPFEYRRVG